MALLAGISIQEYMNAPAWQLIFYNAVASRVIQIRGEMKKNEIQALQGS